MGESKLKKARTCKWCEGEYEFTALQMSAHGSECKELTIQEAKLARIGLSRPGGNIVSPGGVSA